MPPLQLLLDVGSGGLVGFVLGLAGGGGSILAVPLMVYAVGVQSPHVAVGTSAVAVAANAAAGLFGHAKQGLVDWRSGSLFASGGVFGALLGAQAGKLIDGRRLMLLFALLMLAVAASMMLRRRVATDLPAAASAPEGMTARLLGVGAGTGLLSGIFGIGGGFLIVPGLMSAARLPARRACATSLLAVAAFGITTSASYAWSGLVSWGLAALFVLGGTGGMMAGTRAAGRLASGERLVPTLAAMISGVAMFILARSLLGA